VDTREEENFVVECLFRRGSVSPLLTMLRENKFKKEFNFSSWQSPRPPARVWDCDEGFYKRTAEAAFGSLACLRDEL